MSAWSRRQQNHRAACIQSNALNTSCNIRWKEALRRWSGRPLESWKAVPTLSTEPQECTIAKDEPSSSNTSTASSNDEEACVSVWYSSEGETSPIGTRLLQRKMEMQQEQMEMKKEHEAQHSMTLACAPIVLAAQTHQEGDTEVTCSIFTEPKAMPGLTWM